MALPERVTDAVSRLTPGGRQPIATSCWVCATTYRPKLTAGECPVCGRPTDGLPASALPSSLDPDTRVTLMVVAAMAANLLILAVLAGMYLTS